MTRLSWYQRLRLAILILLAAARKEKPPTAAVSARHIVGQPEDEPDPPAVHPRGESKR